VSEVGAELFQLQLAEVLILAVHIYCSLDQFFVSSLAGFSALPVTNSVVSGTDTCAVSTVTRRNRNDTENEGVIAGAVTPNSALLDFHHFFFLGGA